MSVSPELVREFVDHLRDDYGLDDVSFELAEELANSLVIVFGILARADQRTPKNPPGSSS